MRYMVIVKATKDSEAGVMPSEKLLTEMGAYNDELVKAGVMLSGEGLQPSSKGFRVRFNGDKRTVVDGPFAETKELVAGFWTWKVKSKEEAIEWAKRCPNPHPGESVLEFRQVFETEDFGDAMTPELREQEDRQRAELDKQQASAAHTTNVFVNLSVKDLKKSKELFAKLGYTFNPQFTDDNAACMVISPTIYCMLLVESYFTGFTSKPIPDAKKTNESIVALSMGSRDAVKAIVEKAFAAGARRYADPKDYGFMYQWGFEDLDGHIWEYVWMDPAHLQK